MPPLDSSISLSIFLISYQEKKILVFLNSLMIPELEKPRVTEIQVRMDCNGCVQKIKKALHGINGIYDLQIDFPQQKLTIIGWADPEKIIKAIKKTRKIATICSDTEQPTEPPPTEPASEANGQQQEQPPPPPQDAAAAEPNPPPAEAPPPEQAPPAEPPKDPPPPENPPPQPEPQPCPVASDTNNAGHPVQASSSSGPKDVGEVHVIYHHPPDYGYRYGYGHGYGHGYNGYWNKYQNSQGHPPQEVPAPPVYVTHSYNTYKPSPYVTEYEYIRSPPSQTYYHNRVERYNEEPNQYYYNVTNGNNGNITSIFSDENPNACRIV